MTASFLHKVGAGRALRRLMLTVFLLALTQAALAEEKAQLFATEEDGFVRLVLSFPDRLDLPSYKISYENSVLAVEFTEELDATLPDVAVALEAYVGIARVDPDRRGVRFALRRALKINHLEAGGKLFIDLMPPSWQGLPPGLPPDVVAELALRARETALEAERLQKAADAIRLKPVATLRVGRNPTFMRVEFNWNVPTEAEFTVDGDGVLDFSWPVPIDLYAMKADSPPELLGVDNLVTRDGSRIVVKVADGVVPRFYKTSDTRFVLDIDIAPATNGPTIEEALAALAAPAVTAEDNPASQVTIEGVPSAVQAEIEPAISTVGDTVRVAFPFDRDTAAAVFRRGDTIWMLFDTPTTIRPAPANDALNGLATAFTVQSAGETQVVRLDLAVDRLATLGSEGRNWVLSLGDTLINAVEPVPLSRRRDAAGRFEMVADLQKPSQVHQFRDPVVGDVLSVVTAFPPARGVARPMGFVDFSALPTIMGLVVKPAHDAVRIDLDARLAVIHAEGGLALSPIEQLRSARPVLPVAERSNFLDLFGPSPDDPGQFVARREELLTIAAEAEGAAQDAARLELAGFYIANRLGEEAIGVLEVLQADNRTPDLEQPVRFSLAVARTLAHRPTEALEVLAAPVLSADPDAAMWRTLSRAVLGDFTGARLDALAAETVIEAYPSWVQLEFLLAGTRAAVEANDFVLAQHFLDMLDVKRLEPEAASYFRLFAGRIAEADNRPEEALASYGAVIASEIRPTRAEAVYRSTLLLDQLGRIDLAIATEFLSAEALLWRGDRLEAQIQRLLAELYFRKRDYREGFETVRLAVLHTPEGPANDALLGKAQAVFTELYLDGLADQMEPLPALGLFYDHRELTPPGARGDEMIRNLANRLVKVDLLAQAGDLLEYQIESRLNGVAQAQVAADLAVIRIAERNPEAALRVLNTTRVADLSPALERQRRLLEARAMIDAGRQDLALDLLGGLSGRDADLLRVEGYWKAKQYLAAAELLEVMYSAGEPGEGMSQPARMNIIRSAVGFVLAGDRFGLSRLRSKFAERMANSGEWAVFDYVTGEVASQSAEFRQVARDISAMDSLNAFLAGYKRIYGGDDGAAPDHAAPGEGAL